MSLAWGMNYNVYIEKDVANLNSTKIQLSKQTKNYPLPIRFNLSPKCIVLSGNWSIEWCNLVLCSCMQRVMLGARNMFRKKMLNKKVLKHQIKSVSWKQYPSSWFDKISSWYLIKYCVVRVPACNEFSRGHEIWWVHRKIVPIWTVESCPEKKTLALRALIWFKISSKVPNQV